MAALIMLRIYGTTLTTTNARGRFLTGAVLSDGSITTDVSRTSNDKLACQRADVHGDTGFVHDTHTGRTVSVAELKDLALHQ